MVGGRNDFVLLRNDLGKRNAYPCHNAVSTLYVSHCTLLIRVCQWYIPK